MRCLEMFPAWPNYEATLFFHNSSIEHSLQTIHFDAVGK